MSRTSHDLHGNAPDKAATALLLIDVINDLEFDEGEAMLAAALAMADKIAALKTRCQQAGIPVIYVNDNFGRWQSNFNAQVEHVLHDGVRGEPIAKRLLPGESDYFVLKPKHSGFFSTQLDLLLDHLEVRTVIVTGLAGNICVLFTASDAYLRDYKIIVPRDCVASNTPAENDAALQLMAKILKADTRNSDELEISALLQ